MIESKLIFCVVIPGRPIVKKNTARKFGRGRSTRVVYTPKYQAWEAEALRHLMSLRLGVTWDLPIEARFTFHFANHHAEADVSNLVEGPQDILTKARIITDDRIIKRIVAEKVFGQEPKTVIELWTYEERIAA